MAEALPSAARIAELKAAIRYWEGEAARGAPGAGEKLDECRRRLAQLHGGGAEQAGC